MLLVASILVILIGGYAQYRNGLSSAFFMLIAVLLAGLIAFNFWEPLADLLDPILHNGTLAGCEDLIALTLIFGLALFLLRLTIFNYLAPDMIDQQGKLQHLGAGVVGLLVGYLVAGFLTCALQTLPLDANFLDYEPRSSDESPFRSLLPPDRVWLTLMHRAGTHALKWPEDRSGADDTHGTFDKLGTFELRYLRYRRSTEMRPPMPYLGEFDRELYGKQKPR